MRNLLTALLFMSLIIMFSLDLGVYPIKAAPETIYVDDDNVSGPWDGTQNFPYQNITSALVNASTGDKIYVYSGVYVENPVLNKSVSLVGQGKDSTIIDGNRTGDVLRITADDACITGFTIKQSGLASEFCGIAISTSRGVNISHNIIRDNYYGVKLDYSDNNTLMHNQVFNNTYGITVGASAGNLISENAVFLNTYTGISCANSINITIASNNISANDLGIVLLISTNNTLMANDLHSNNVAGIYTFNSTGNLVVDNSLFSNKDFGIWMSDSKSNYVEENRINSNDRFGVYLTNSTANIIWKNSYAANKQFGIRLDESPNNTVASNTITETGVRGLLLFYSDGNRIFHNNLVNNTGSITSINSTNFFDNGSEGNYWQEYDGSDAEQDGIGDTPHIIDQDNQDDYPLMGSFTDFNIIHLNETHHVTTICNSTVTEFGYNETFKMISFAITLTPSQSGFCRIAVPERLISRPQVVLIDENETTATLLPMSNATHSLLYFSYNYSASNVRILDQLYDELFRRFLSLDAELKRYISEYESLELKYNQTLIDLDLLNQEFLELLDNYTTLEVLYNNQSQTLQDLWTEFDSLNSTYYETLNNYTTLKIDFQILKDQYDSLVTLYNNMTNDYDTLNQAYWVVRNNLTSLQTEHTLLNEAYQNLVTDYESLYADYNALLAEFDLALNSAYANATIFAVISLVATPAAAVTSFLAIRYHRKLKQEKRLTEQYKSELEMAIARAQFETDVQRRKGKIEDFTKKYGVAVHPHDTLEEVIQGLEPRRKKEE